MLEGMSDAQIARQERDALAPPKNRDENAIRELAARIREIAYQLHVYLGTGYLEKVYENALKHRLEKAGLKVRQQVPIRVYDEDGFQVGFYEADLVVDGCMILELKAVSDMTSAHVAQLMNYLKATGVCDGMLINFGSEKFEITKRVFGVTPHPSSPTQPFATSASSVVPDRTEL